MASPEEATRRLRRGEAVDPLRGRPPSLSSPTAPPTSPFARPPAPASAWEPPRDPQRAALYRDEATRPRPVAPAPPPTVPPQVTVARGPAVAPPAAPPAPEVRPPQPRTLEPVDSETTMYVRVDDFFGGLSREDDPVLKGWRQDAPGALDPEHTRPSATVGQDGAEAASHPAADAPLPTTEDEGSARSVARNSALMAAGTMVSRVLGMVRTAMLTIIFGMSVTNDAFQVANTLPNYVYILLSAGVLNAVLVPQITKALKRPDGGQAFVDRLLTASIGLVVLTAVVATLAAPWLVTAITDLPPEAHRTAVFFAYLCLPQIAFYGLYTVLGALLNARGEFAAFMWAPALANIIQIAGLVWYLVQYGPYHAGKTFSTDAMVLLGLSATLGIVVQGLSLFWPLWRDGFRWTPRFDLRGHGLGQASKMLGWTFTALVIAQIGGFAVVKIMTAVKGADDSIPSVAARDHAFQIFMLPHSFVTVSILTAIFPAMSRAFQDGNMQSMRDLVRRSLNMPAVAVIPMSVAMMAMSVPIVRFLLPGYDAVAVGLILAAMSLGTMAFGVTTLQQRYCFAREDGRTNLWLQVLLTVIQVAIACGAFLVPAHWAVFVVALGQTIANTVAGVAFVLVARRQLGGLNLSPVVSLYLKVTFASLVAGAVAFGLVWVVGLLGEGFLTAILQLAVAGCAFLAVCFVLLRRFRIPEVEEVLAPVMRRLRRG